MVKDDFCNTYLPKENAIREVYEGKEYYVEYAQSLILSQKRKPEVKNATKKAIEQFKTLIAEIFNDVFDYIGSEFTEGTQNKIEGELRFISILRYLFVRGESYPEHQLEMIKDIFKDHDTFLKKHYDFNSSEVILVIQHIEEQLTNNIKQQIEIISLLHESHELFKNFVDKKNIDNFSSIENLLEKFSSVPEVQKKIKKLDKIPSKNPFEITPNDKIPVKLLKLLSSHLGDNLAFSTFKKSPAWPTNDSIIYERPLIEDNGKFYCFAPQVLFRNIGNILERWIKNKNNDYYQNTYQRKRAIYIENKTLEYLKKILPSAEVYGKLFYYIEENGERKQVETDGLILYDENIFIIEAKAGTFSTSARRGSIRRIKRDVTKLVDDAYNQALRTKKYIMKTPESKFYFKDGSKALIIKDLDKFKNIYLINVTLQYLGQLSTQLNYLKSLKRTKSILNTNIWH